MERLRIALLIAAHEAEHTRRNFRREVDADLVEFHVPSGQLPATFDFDGAIVTGSRASVYWDDPWIAELKSWVGEAIETGMPFLGVCYGHQLLADVLGGTVEDMGEYEIGYRTVAQTDESILLEGIGQEFTTFTTHSDYVSEIPPGATLIAENDYGVHGFRQGEVFAVQFHPEYDMETAELVTHDKEADLSEETLTRVIDGINTDNYGAACEAKRLFENFTTYVRSRKAKGAGGSAGATSD